MKGANTGRDGCARHHSGSCVPLTTRKRKRDRKRGGNRRGPEISLSANLKRTPCEYLIRRGNVKRGGKGHDSVNRQRDLKGAPSARRAKKERRKKGCRENQKDLVSSQEGQDGWENGGYVRKVRSN